MSADARQAAVERAADAIRKFAEPDEGLGWLGLPEITPDIATEIADYLDAAALLRPPGDATTDVEYSARFKDGHIGPEQDDIRSARFYADYCGDGFRGGVDALVRREVTRIEGPWEVVDDVDGQDS